MQGLGELEAAVMNVLWTRPGPHRVRDVLEQLAPQRTLAYTTVMTVLDNLHRKSWVQREMDGRAYHYLPSASREEVTARALRTLLDSAGDVVSVPSDLRAGSIDMDEGKNDKAVEKIVLKQKTGLGPSGQS